MSAAQMEAILNGPVETPPAGKTTNLVDPPNMYTAGIIVFAVCATVPTVFVAIRFYTKMFLIRRLLLSDYLMFVAWAMTIIFIGLSFRLNAVAPGIDEWNLKVKDFISMLHWFYFLALLYGISSWLVKTVLLIQLLEIFGHRKDLFYWSCKGMIIGLSFFYTILTFSQIFACHPIHNYWNVLVKDRRCLDTAGLNVSTSAINAASDLIILLLPQFRIWSLNMGQGRRWTVAIVFMFGVIATASSLVRLAYAAQFYETTQNSSYYLYMSGIWCIPEIGAGVLTGCLPALPRFYGHIRHIWRDRSRGSRRYRRRMSPWYKSNGYVEQAAKDPDNAKFRDTPPQKANVSSVDMYPLTSVLSHPESIYDAENPMLTSRHDREDRYDQQRAVPNLSGRH